MTNKDGDYNKQIPEMHGPSQLNKKYCVNNGAHPNAAAQQSSSNILCQKCNNYQEQKLVELKKFETRCEVRFYAITVNDTKTLLVLANNDYIICKGVLGRRV
jgi:hypothetical protein